MSKYIIKNCPACYLCRNKYVCDKNNDKFCKYITDCVLKQIVELCKNQKAKTTYEAGMRDKAIQILELLDIQEVE